MPFHDQQARSEGIRKPGVADMRLAGRGDFATTTLRAGQSSRPTWLAGFSQPGRGQPQPNGLAQ